MLVQAQTDDGYTRHRYVSNGEGDGAVAVVVRDERVLFVRLYRPATGRVLIELPRGQRDRDDANAVETAYRETLEETGWRASQGEIVGEAWPDSGLCGDCTQIVRFSSAEEPTEKSLADAEVSDVLWLSDAEIRERIATGEIADGITISALVTAAVL